MEDIFFCGKDTPLEDVSSIMKVNSVNDSLFHLKRILVC